MIPVVFSYGGWQTANYVAGEIKDAAAQPGPRPAGRGVAVIAALSAGQHRLPARAGRRGPRRDPDAGLRRACTARSGRSAAKLAAGGHRPLGPGLPEPVDADRPAGLFRHGPGRPVLPAAWRRSRETSRAPAIAIVLQAAWTGVLALSGSYEQILSYVIAMNFLFFGLSASCLFVLRRRERRRATMVRPRLPRALASVDHRPVHPGLRR